MIMWKFTLHDFDFINSLTGNDQPLTVDRIIWIVGPKRIESEYKPISANEWLLTAPQILYGLNCKVVFFEKLMMKFFYE